MCESDSNLDHSRGKHINQFVYNKDSDLHEKSKYFGRDFILKNIPLV